MINLLPPSQQEEIRYARRNTHLLRWITALSFGTLGIVVILLFGYLFLSQSIKSNVAQAADTSGQLKQQHIDETQKKVENLSSNLNLVVGVLSKEVLFSKLLQQIGSVMPNGTALTGLTINKVSGGLDLSAKATNYQAATQVQVNLSDPKNQIFEKADIIQVSCGSGNNTDPIYPCTISLKALFAKNNSFQFIKNGGGK